MAKKKKDLNQGAFESTSSYLRMLGDLTRAFERMEAASVYEFDNITETLTELDDEIVQLAASHHQERSKTKTIKLRDALSHAARKRSVLSKTRYGDNIKHHKKSLDALSMRINREGINGTTLVSILMKTVNQDARDDYFITEGIRNQSSTNDLWTWLRLCRVFHIDPEVYRQIDIEVTRFLISSEPTIVYDPERHGSDIFDCLIEHGGPDFFDKPDSPSCRVAIGAYDMADNQPFPENLPFDYFFLGLGTGLLLQQGDLIMRRGIMVPEEMKILSLRIVGFLFAWDGRIFEVIEWTSREMSGHCFEIHYDAEWKHPLSRTPWVLHGIMSAIHQHKSVIVQGSHRNQAMKTLMKKVNRKLRFTQLQPPPFYHLKLKSELFFHTACEAAIPKQTIERLYTHRWDVRRHERCRIKRGVLPIDPEIKTRLTSNGYVLFEDRPLDDAHLERLTIRGKPLKSNNEWVAVLTTLIEPHISGPEDAPYVPAVRIIDDMKPLESGFEP